MRRCWLLIITNGLRVWMPPEVYLEKTMAAREARRWAGTVSRKRLPDEIFTASSIRLRDHVLLHLIEGDFVEPWRACPLWVGVRCSDKSYPRISVELMVADSDEAIRWVETRSKHALDPRIEPDYRLESTFERRSVPTYVAAHRVKMFSGF